MIAKNLLRILAGTFLLAVLGGCASNRAGNPSPPTADVVEAYIAALNRRDLLALTAYVTPDVEWYSIVNGERLLEVSGREALAKSLQQYFTRYTQTKWVLQAMQSLENRVAVTERSEWIEDGRAQQRSSLGVYELSDGRIRRITYFLDGG